MKDGKIAVPSIDQGGIKGNRSDHFGHCELFTLVEIEEGCIKNVSTMINEAHKAGGCLKPVINLKNSGVDALVVSGIGKNPFLKCEEAGIKVFHADKEQYPDVETTVQDLILGKLSQIHPNQLCKGSANCHSL